MSHSVIASRFRRAFTGAGGLTLSVLPAARAPDSAAKELTVRSASGNRDDVVVNLKNIGRAAEMMEGSELANMTFKNGQRAGVSGAYNYPGTISNCAFVAAYLRNLGGVGSDIYPRKS